MFGLFAGKSSPRPRLEGEVFAIGDIHGRRDLLKDLVDLIGERAVTAEPELVFLGDYVDRGPDSCGVIDFALYWPRLNRFRTIFLKGNHEAALLRFLDDPAFGPEWARYGGGETLASYGIAPPALKSDNEAWHSAQATFTQRLPKAHLTFLQTLKLSYERGPYFFVHAGVDPQKALNDQDEESLLWIRDDFLLDRRRLPRIIVHGHTPEMKPHVDDRRIGIDTGAYQTNVLTAVRLYGAEIDIIQAS